MSVGRALNTNEQLIPHLGEEHARGEIGGPGHGERGGGSGPGGGGGEEGHCLTSPIPLK